MGLRGGRLLRSGQARAVRSAAALLLLSGVASTGLLALSTPAHAIAPAPTITSPADGTTSTDPSPAVTFTGGGVQYECAVTSVAQPTPSWTACPSPWSVPTLAADGTYALQVREQTATNDGAAASVSYTLDTVAHLTVAPPASPGNDPRPTWQVSVEPGGAASCSLDGGPATGCTGGFVPATDLTEGPHTLVVTATDAVGNTSAPDTSSYTLDTTAPAAPTVTGSSGTSNDTSPSWSWSNPEGATALCTLATPAGSGTEAPCTSSTSFTKQVSGDGDYVLSVVLRDAAGNRSQVGTGPTYTLDTTPSAPAVFTAQPAGPSTSTTVSWSFTTPGAGTTCALIGTSHGTVATGPCTSPASYTLPGDDSWKLVVTEDDGHGNTVSTTSSAYLLDTTGPAAPVVTAPSGLSNDPTPHVTWTGEMPTTAECRWERTAGGTTTDGPWTDCGAAFFDPVLPGDGSYTFSARLTDPLGNVGAIGTSAATYVYDGTAPLPPALTTPSTPGNDTTPTVTFTPETPGGTAACTFYSGTTAPASPTWTSCTTGSYTPSLPADGTWTIAVTLSDAAGNTSAPSEFTYELDTAAPAAVVISGPTGPSNVRTPSWSLSGDPTTTITCQVRPGIPATGTPLAPATGCTTSYTADLSSAADGGYTLEVTARDAAGNTTTSSWPYSLDTTAPTAPVVSGPTGTGNASAPSWTFPVQSGTTAQCRLVQGLAMSGWSDCSSGRFTVTDPADGTYTVDVLVTDLAGNPAPIASSAPYTSDRTAPLAPDVTGPTGPGNSTTPNWHWTGEAGVSATCRLDRAGVVGSAVPCNTGSFSPALSGDTSYVVVVQLTDAAGNASPATTTAPYLLDTVAPATPVVSGPSGPSNVATVAWSWTAESGSTSQCVLVRNGAPGPSSVCTSGSSWTLPSDGSYALQVTVVDAAGNPSVTVQTPTYTLDRVAPSAPSVTTPASPSSSLAPAFTFSAEPGAATQCRLMRGTTLVRDWTACTNPPAIDLTGLADATYSLDVRATDAAGNTGPVGSSLGYQLDTTAPAAPTVTVPSSPSRVTTPTVTWVGESGTTASCRLVLNGTAQTATPCTSPWTPTLSSDGSWVVRVRLTDAAGNVGLAGVSSTYVLDTTPPTAPVVSPPAPLGRSTAPSWSASYETGATAECRLTSGATVVTDWAGCALPYVTDLSALPDATYTLSVRVTDEVGLVSPVGSATYQLDTTAPAAPVFTSAPASPGRSKALSFSFTTEPGTTTFCKLTSGATTVSPETTCTSPLPVSLAGLPDGAYTLSARSVDAAGNAGPTQTATYVLDTTAPAAPVLISGPAATAPDKTPTWTFTAETGATVTCRVTGTAGFSSGGTCTSPYSVALPADDTYTFTATATDAAGNTSAALTRTYVLDSTAPATADVVGPRSPGKLTSPTWQVSSSEGTIQCQLVKGTATLVRDWATCGPTFSVPLPGDGSYTLSARVVDAAGNLSPVVTSTYVLDTVPPAPATIVTPSSPSTDRAPSFVISSSEPSVTAQCQVTGPAGVVAAFAGCPISTAGTSYNLTLAGAPDGSYTLAVRLTDAAGNTGATATATYVLDTTPPSAVLVTAPASPSADDTPTWALTGDSDAVLECRLSGPGFTSPTFSACPTGAVPGSGSYTSDLTSRADGTYTLTVRSRDAAGNLGPESSSSYALDRTPPVTPAPPSVPASPANVATVDWAFSVEAGSTALCTLSSASAVVSPEAPCTSPLTTVLPADGTYTLTLRARDPAGNLSGTSTASYVYDSTPPAAPSIDTELASPNPDTTPTWQLTPSEPGDRLMCQLVGLPTAGFATCSSPVTYDLSSWTSGVYHLEVVEYDAAGNASPVATGKTYVLDTTAPAAAHVYPPSPAIGNSTSPVFDIERDPADTDTVRISCTVTRLGVADGTVADPCAYGPVNRIDLSDLPAGTEGKIGLGVFDYDSAGNTQSEPATAYYAFDNKPPVAPLIRPLKDVEGLSPKVSWSFGPGDAENVAFACVVAKRGTIVTPAEAVACSGTKDVTLASYGDWVLTVWAKDAAGNDSAPATSSYLYLPPVPVVTSVRAPATGTDSTPTWTFSVPRGYTAGCLVSDSHGTTISSGDCSSGRVTADLGNLPAGVYTLTVQLTDSHGNRGAYSAPSAYRYAPRTSADGHLGQPGPATTPGHGGGSTPGSTPGTRAPGPTTGGGAPSAGGSGTPASGPGHPATGLGLPGTGALTGAGASGGAQHGGKSGSSVAGTVLATPAPGGFITKEATKAIGKTLAQVAQKPTIPLLLLAVVVGFLLLQNRIDRRDPKLASAPVGAEPELDFGPVQQVGRRGLLPGTGPGPRSEGRTGGAPA